MWTFTWPNGEPALIVNREMFASAGTSHVLEGQRVAAYDEKSEPHRAAGDALVDAALEFVP